MSVFREATIHWDGSDYTFVPSMKMLRAIERGRPGEGPISLVNITNQAISGNIQVSFIVQVIYDVMQHAGVKGVSEESLYQEFHNGKPDTMVALWYSIVEAISPTAKEGNVQAAQDE